VLSKSQLQRYEAGVCLPALEHAEHLDRLYDGQGWVEMALRSLWRARWNPWTREHGNASTHHAGIWPAAYEGMVWIKLKPWPEHADQPHHLTLNWGPWTTLVEHVITKDGLILTTGKAADLDRVAVTCNLDTEPEAFALFGAGTNSLDQDLATVVDLRSAWTRQ
jgi:hypothetical protein